MSSCLVMSATVEICSKVRWHFCRACRMCVSFDIDEVIEIKKKPVQTQPKTCLFFSRRRCRRCRRMHCNFIFSFIENIE